MIYVLYSTYPVLRCSPRNSLSVAAALVISGFAFCCERSGWMF